MQKAGIYVLAVGILAVGAMLVTSGGDAQARPAYMKAFAKKYPDVKEAATTKCNVCHVGKKKTDRNDYGKALGKILVDDKHKDTKDMEIIDAALDKVAGEGDFGKNLKDGKLPAGE